MTNFLPGTMPRPKPVPVQTKLPFSFVHINKCAGSSIEIALGIQKQHLTAVQMRDRIGEEAWARSLSFAVVRHPAARAASIYFFRRRLGIWGLDDGTIDPNDWVRAVWQEHDPRFTNGSILTAPAYDWITDGDKVIVDTILRFERLAEDWRLLARRLGAPETLGVWNANPHPPWDEVFSPKARTTLAEAFAADIDHFGYKI